MNLATFRTLVAAFMQRDENAFVVGTTNLISNAVLLAMRAVEKLHNFEMSRVQGVLAVHYQNGADLSGMKLASDGITSVAVKALAKAFLPYTDGSGQFPVDIVSRDKHVSQLARHYESVFSCDPRQSAPSSTSKFQVVRFANTVYISPADSTVLGGETVNVYFDLYKWLPELTDTTSNFLLDYCPEALLTYVMYYMNIGLKEDQRVAISATARNEALAAMRAWDASVIHGTAEDANLD